MNQKPPAAQSANPVCSQDHPSRLHRLFLACGHFFFRVRNGLFPCTLLLLFFFTRPARFLGYPVLDKFLVAAGIAIALAGASFRMAVIGYAYIQRGGKDGKIHADRLVVRGFYAHTRNPMYVGNFLITVGMSLIYGSVWACGIVIPFFAFVYLSIVVAEEAYLLDRFGGDYETYTKRVHRFLPALRGITEVPAGVPLRLEEGSPKRLRDRIRDPVRHSFPDRVEVLLLPQVRSREPGIPASRPLCPRPGLLHRRPPFEEEPPAGFLKAPPGSRRSFCKKDTNPR